MITNSERVQQKRCCGTCVHYRQHYVLNKENRFVSIWYGHCISSEIKEREPDAVCPNWMAAISFDDSPQEVIGGDVRSYPIRFRWE